jgi:hypothetical protein
VPDNTSKWNASEWPTIREHSKAADFIGTEATSGGARKEVKVSYPEEMGNLTTRAAIAESRAFTSWQDYQEALKRAVAPLTDEQLSQRLLPSRRSPGEIAEHIVFGRALHLSRTLGADAAELAPYRRWEDEGDPPRSAAEIVQGLEATWRIIENRLMRGSSADTLIGGESEVVRTIWGLLDHDLPHAGQLSLVLRAMGIPGVDI